jgi:hypothetical protein
MSTKRKVNDTPAKQGPRLSRARLDELVDEALVDADTESQQATAFYEMMDSGLRLPFETEILGAAAIVESIDITGDDKLVGDLPEGQDPPADLAFGIAVALAAS